MRFYHLTKEMRHQPEHLTLVQNVMGSNRGRGFFFLLRGKVAVSRFWFSDSGKKKNAFFRGKVKNFAFHFFGLGELAFGKVTEQSSMSEGGIYTT